MRFENSYMLLNIFWFILIAVVFFIIITRRNRILAEAFVQRDLWKEVLGSLNSRQRRIKAVLICVAIIFILLAISRPQLGFQWEETKRYGRNVIFAVDVSRSMLAKDIKPNRLERAKLAITDLVAKLPGDRIGLIAFSGTAFTQAPLTLDYDGFMLALKDLDIDSIPRGGTSLSAAIKEAIRVYEIDASKDRTLIIISDGEEHEGDSIKIAKEAKKRGIEILSVGVGSVDGSFVEVSDSGGNSEFLEDRHGAMVKSCLNEALLRKIAFLTGGSYIRGSSVEFGLEKIYSDKVMSKRATEKKGKKKKRYNERFQIPLALAIMMLCIELALSDRRDLVT
ncbi:VWA domain-containing protein [Candidatus Omnitrophota bacterium]